MVATQEDLLSLSSSVSRIIKRGFGKGPETCYTVLKENRLYVYIRNFMTSAEEILINNNEYNLVMEFRSSVITALSKELVQEATQLLGLTFEFLYQDWNFHSNRGILMIMSNSYIPNVKLEDSFERKLLQLVRTVGSQLHKIPSELKVTKYTLNTCVIEAKGVMLPLESLLRDEGKTDLLITYTREIKKGYYHHRELFEEMFNRSIEDIFIMWDFNYNKSYLIFSFNKVYP